MWNLLWIYWFSINWNLTMPELLKEKEYWFVQNLWEPGYSRHDDLHLQEYPSVEVKDRLWWSGMLKIALAWSVVCFIGYIKKLFLFFPFPVVRNKCQVWIMMAPSVLASIFKRRLRKSWEQIYFLRIAPQKLGYLS